LSHSHSEIGTNLLRNERTDVGLRRGAGSAQVHDHDDVRPNKHAAAGEGVLERVLEGAIDAGEGIVAGWRASVVQHGERERAREGGAEDLRERENNRAFEGGGLKAAADFWRRMQPRRIYHPRPPFDHSNPFCLERRS
jgi:hypothetical protein